ncbi:endonuclease NucS [Natrialbaceae archaeon AArc-T1-2]|uniref:endonuclease NucS n=1 Tax=Natrialbaceae archaeon AArc-T1-2 TaxID=3053904 RepID=UPI00255AE20F|nr:endonuclease NucS [Natrialbaceae archaeon AArc-T1-2]WIV67675.1 endonuclease NucS [Natrialbaceae archaeon AArc-T1-2]
MTASEQDRPGVTRESPTLETARDAIAEGIARGTLVTVVGRCTVEYDGRAASTLEAGDRHVMCKPDGTVLVHTDEGQQPINWQPPGCDQETFLEDRRLHLESLRSSPAERLLVSFDRVYQVSSFRMTDPEELAVVGTERDLKERILEDPDLLEAGFRPLATERETPAGAVDIYGEDETGRTVVVELKRRRVGPDAVGQLRRYVDAVERDLHTEAELRGILVAPSVTDRARRLLAEHGLEFVSLEPTAD